MTFLYPFITFLQPGIVWPALVPYRPFLILSILAVMVGACRGDARAQVAAKLSHPVFLWLCAYVVIQALSVYYSGMLAMLEELDFWSTYAIFVAVSLFLVTDSSKLYRFLAGMLAGSAIVIGYGLYAVATHSPQLAGNRAGAYGMYENHNDFTFLILMALPYAWLLFGIARRRAFRLFLACFVVACIAGVILSLSRGGIIALVLMIVLLYCRTTSGIRRAAGIAAIALLGPLVISHQFVAREENQAGHYTLEDSEDSRYELWRAARKIIDARPILGVGSGRFSEYARDYAELSHNNIGKVSHNTYLEVATGSGVLGLTTFIMMLMGIVKASTDRWRSNESHVPARMRSATQICILTIMLRAMLDAKTYDWSFYFLAVLGILIATLPAASPQREGALADEPTLVPAAAPTVQARPHMAAGRPMVYGRRT